MSPQKIRAFRNDFLQTLWRAREAIARRDIVTAAEMVTLMTAMRETGERLFLDSDILDRFDADIWRIQAQIGGN